MEDGGTDTEQLMSANTKILGVNYDPKNDNFHFKSYSRLLEKGPTFTKRGISSLIPSIFDVNGIISPYILKGKVILSRVWAYEHAETPPGPEQKVENPINDVK